MAGKRKGPKGLKGQKSRRINGTAGPNGLSSLKSSEGIAHQASNIAVPSLSPAGLTVTGKEEGHFSHCRVGIRKGRESIMVALCLCVVIRCDFPNVGGSVDDEDFGDVGHFASFFAL